MRYIRLPSLLNTTMFHLLRRLCAVAVTLACWPHLAAASCNQIPGATNNFRGAVGSVSRPFAGPGDFVELRLNSPCDGARAFATDATAHVVSIIFTPTDGPRTLVAIAGDCAAVDAQAAACASQPGFGKVLCVPAFPRDEPANLEVVIDDGEDDDSDLPPRLRFRFPDTDGADQGAPGATLAGPATIAVTPAGAPLACDLMTRPCSAQDAALTFCVDRFSTADGSCGSAPHELFASFTALPRPNDYQALCVDPIPPCTGNAEEMRFTTDLVGNVLMPVDWRGILVGETVPIARLLRAGSSIEAFPGSGKPIRVPGQGFLQSFAPEGGLLPPIFEPQVDVSRQGEMVLFGSADAPATVLRIARRSPRFMQCEGGEADGQACTDDAHCAGGACVSATCVGGARAGETCGGDDECPGGECGPSIFDFRSRLSGITGPLIVPRFGAGVCQDSGVPCSDDGGCGESRCVRYRFSAQDPVSLEGLSNSRDLFLSVVPEAVDKHDLNGDGDTLDHVLLLNDRQTGLRRPIGVAAAPGRAAARINESPFNYPAVVVEGDVAAFLEAEPAQGHSDANGDDDLFDAILRIYRVTETGIEAIAADQNVPVDAAPQLNQRSLVVSDGIVYYRRAEAGGARRRVSRVSRAADGSPGNADSQWPSLSADGAHVAFVSEASNLDGAPPAGDPTAFVWDRDGEQATRVVLDESFVGADATVSSPAISGDGRLVAVEAMSTNQHSQVFVQDRDADGNGVFDESQGVATSLISRAQQPEFEFGNSHSALPSISANGRYVGFLSRSANLYLEHERPQILETDWHPWVHDRDADGNGSFTTFRARAGESAHQGSTFLQAPALSADGRYLGFASFEKNHGPPDDNNNCLRIGGHGGSCLDVLVRDLDAPDHYPDPNPPGLPIDMVSRSSSGEQGNYHSFNPSMSGDARFFAYSSSATNLVAGDTNGALDVFVRDRANGTTTRISVSSEGVEGNGGSGDRVVSMSADGRYIAFSSVASSLVPDDTNAFCDVDADGELESCNDVFIHDRLLGFTERFSESAVHGEGNGRSASPSLSADGHTVAFESRAANLIPGEPNAQCNGQSCQDIFIVEPDPASAGQDLNGDGDVRDVLLQVIDIGQGPHAVPETIAPATAVAVAGTAAVLLVPESATAPGIDLNADGDVLDDVVHLYRRGSGLLNLGLAADAVAMSTSWIVALAPEQNADTAGDADRNDTVLHVAPAENPTAWRAIARADAMQVIGSTVALLTPEHEVDLNGDADGDDRVLQIYFAASDELIDVEHAAEEFVLGDSLLAFRVAESAQGNVSQNDDDDTDDAMMYVYDLASRTLLPTGQAATPCRLVACDPRAPYRVLNNQVKFLTYESDQEDDLNNDGDENDLVLQTFNVRLAAGAMRRGAARRVIPARTRARGGAVHAAALTTLGSVGAGICTDSGDACATAADCGDGAKCFLPPGGCIRDLGITCNSGGLDGCPVGSFCVPIGIDNLGSCHERQGECSSDADCTAPARCQDAGQDFQRIISPLAEEHEVFFGVGRCVEDLQRDCGAGCRPGEFCDGAAGQPATCHREHGSCRTGSDCPGSARCRPELIVATASDSDADGISDPFDNCPSAANPAQDDGDSDGAGDACEAETGPQPTATIPLTTPTATLPPSPAATAPPTANRTSADDDGCAVTPASRGTASPILLMLALMLSARALCRPARRLWLKFPRRLTK